MSDVRTTLAATLLTLIALPLVAPSAAQAYGFAAAKGRTGSGAEVYEWCTKSTVASARTCALDKCNDASASACKIVRDCSDGKWSGIAEAVHKDDARKHDSACGWSKKTGKKSLKTSLATKCAGLRDKNPKAFKRCMATVIEPDQDVIDNAYSWRWRNGKLSPE